MNTVVVDFSSNQIKTTDYVQIVSPDTGISYGVIGVRED